MAEARLALPIDRLGSGDAGERGAVSQPLRSPDTRARVVGYLATAPIAAAGFRTDGTWIWPQGLAEWVRSHGEAPSALFVHLRRSRFLLPETVPVELLDRAGALAGSALAGGIDAALLEPDTVDGGGATVTGPPRLAQLYDGLSPDGTGRFTPDRLRIPEPLRRERLASFLRGGRLILRAPGDVPDPLDPTSRIRLDYRTDGWWVWPEALAHYVTIRGVGPELDLLCHIEERGYRVADVSDQAAQAALAVIRPPAARTVAPMSYLRGPDGELARVAGPDGEVEILRQDLRWGLPRQRIDPVTRALGFRPIDEEEASAELGARWASGLAEPPLD